MTSGSVNATVPSTERLTRRRARRAYRTSRTRSACARIDATGSRISGIAPEETPLFVSRSGEPEAPPSGTDQMRTVASLDPEASTLSVIQSNPNTQSRCPTSNADGVRRRRDACDDKDASSPSEAEKTATSHGFSPPVARRVRLGFREMAWMPQFSKRRESRRDPSESESESVSNERKSTSADVDGLAETPSRLRTGDSPNR